LLSGAIFSVLGSQKYRDYFTIFVCTITTTQERRQHATRYDTMTSFSPGWKTRGYPKQIFFSIVTSL